MEITNTYQVVGKLQKEGNTKVHKRHIDKQVEATAPWAAIASFEVDGWEFDTVSVTLITEAEKMRQAGQPSLLDLITN